MINFYPCIMQYVIFKMFLHYYNKRFDCFEYRKKYSKHRQFADEKCNIYPWPCLFKGDLL